MLRARWHAVLACGAGMLLALAGAGDPASAALSLPGMAAATLDSVTVSGTNVTLKWTDRSLEEDSFEVWRRTPAAVSSVVRGGVATSSKTGTGQTYTLTDTIPAGTRQCYIIVNFDDAAIVGGNYSNEVCTSALPPLPVPAEGVGIVSALGTTNVVHIQNSTVIGADGLGITAFYEVAGNGNAFALAVTHCDDTECTATTTHAIDTSGDVGRHPSIKIGSDGLPLISYIAYKTAGVAVDDLLVAHCLDVTCSAATTTTIDAASNVNLGTSLTIGSDGLGTIAYFDSVGINQKTFKVAHCQNLACTTATTAIVDSVTGKHNEDRSLLAIATSPTTGLTYVAYNDGGIFGSLKMAMCYNAGCGTKQTYTVDYVPGIGTAVDLSVAIGRDGFPLVSYTFNNGGSTALAVGHCLNIYCSGLQRRIVDLSGKTGGYSSLAIGADGLPIISYQNETTQNLLVAHCANADCSAVSNGTLLDEFGNVGQYTSIAIGADGLPLITYYDATNRGLKVAHCADAACVQPLSAPFFRK